MLTRAVWRQGTEFLKRQFDVSGRAPNARLQNSFDSGTLVESFDVGSLWLREIRKNCTICIGFVPSTTPWSIPAPRAHLERGRCQWCEIMETGTRWTVASARPDGVQSLVVPHVAGRRVKIFERHGDRRIARQEPLYLALQRWLRVAKTDASRTNARTRLVRPLAFAERGLHARRVSPLSSTEWLTSGVELSLPTSSGESGDMND